MTHTKYIAISGLQVVISAILKAIGPLVNIALLLLFAIIIFAIVGLEFYAGALNSTCYDITDLSECGHTRIICGPVCLVIDGYVMTFVRAITHRAPYFSVQSLDTSGRPVSKDISSISLSFFVLPCGARRRKAIPFLEEEEERMEIR